MVSYENKQKEQEFIVEVLSRLLPNVEWYGETNHDGEALKGLDSVYSALYYCLDKMLHNFYLPSGYENNYSANRLTKRTRELLTILIDDFNLEKIIKDLKDENN